MLFSVITPSFRANQWLRLCVASVADQGVELEHLVQDAESDDGTLEWLPQDRRVKAVVEKDEGMYDAINRGLRRARGDLLAYLNCDEQYLPGALQSVAAFFEQHPEVDMVFGDAILVDPTGNYLAHRKMVVPLQQHTRVSHLSTLTCGTFFRRRLLAEQGLFFDTRWRAAGDAEWMLRVLQSGARLAVLQQFTSAFTQTGANLGDSPVAVRERQALLETAPWWARQLRPLLVLQHRLRRLAGGVYSQKPFSYNLYTLASPEQRQRFQVQHPDFRWRTHPGTPT